MKRSGLAGVVGGIFLFAAASGHAQVCAPQPTRVDPAYGNFTQTDWPEESFSWVNNAMGAALSGVWANTDFDMWFVGDARPYGFETIEPIAVHFDGFSLQVMRPPGTSSLYGVWGSSSNDVWAVGFNGLILHWDGTQWVSIPSGTNENLYAVAGTASDDVWAAGSKAMRHWDGVSWNDAPGFSPERFDRVTGLAAITRSDALVATSEGCQRWDGTSWQTTACGVIGGRGVFAVNSNDIWVVATYLRIAATTARHIARTGTGRAGLRRARADGTGEVLAERGPTTSGSTERCITTAPPGLRRSVARSSPRCR